VDLADLAGRARDGEGCDVNASARADDAAGQLPETIRGERELDELLSRPGEAAVAALGRLEGDLLVLGVAGKMGPTLARMAVRASQAAGVARRVIGVARFSDPAVRGRLEGWGVQTLQADLLDRRQLERLPDAPNVLFLAGMKFGSSGQEALTWAMNCYVPALVCERFARSRIAAFSTGNVYGLVPAGGEGSKETDPPEPLGDYAMSCLGRERMFEHFSRTLGLPVATLRLNYACELRYGVLADVARRVWAGEPVDVTMGWCNVIWQADAASMALAALAEAASPPRVLNLAGPERLSVRRLAGRFGELLGRPVRIAGREAPDALLSDGRAAYGLLGRPRVTVEQMTRWIADWVRAGGASLDKPTHFEARDGKY